jgi:hypothetical protein
MMGPKTLDEIKGDLRSSLAKTGKHPIQWLEERIQKLQKHRKPNRHELELLRSLIRMLDTETQT